MLLRVYLALAGWAFLVSAVLQVLLPRFTGEHSHWGVAAGWQREIGLWNLGMLVVVNRAVRKHGPAAQRDVALALVCLSMLLGANHVAALVTAGFAPLHVNGVAVNLIGVVLGIVAIRSARPAREAA